MADLNAKVIELEERLDHALRNKNKVAVDLLRGALVYVLLRREELRVA